MMGAGTRKGDSNTTLAAFLVTRPAYGYIGYGWEGCGAHTTSRDVWNPLFDLDVGEPAGNCTEGAPGVFTRKWSKGEASLDCNSFEATLDFQMKQHEQQQQPSCCPAGGGRIAVPSVCATIRAAIGCASGVGSRTE